MVCSLVMVVEASQEVLEATGVEGVMAVEAPREVEEGTGPHQWEGEAPRGVAGMDLRRWEVGALQAAGGMVEASQEVREATVGKREEVKADMAKVCVATVLSGRITIISSSGMYRCG